MKDEKKRRGEIDKISALQSFLGWLDRLGARLAGVFLPASKDKLSI